MVHAEQLESDVEFQDKKAIATSFGKAARLTTNMPLFREMWDIGY